MARRPKPSAINRLNGNPGHRPVNGFEPTPAPGLPDPPKDLTADEKRIWRKVGATLEDLGVATQADSVELEGLAVWLSIFRACIAQARTEKPVVTINGSPATNPHLSLAFKVWDRIHRLAVEFGLSPASRSRLRVDPPQAEDAYLAYLRGEDGNHGTNGNGNGGRINGLANEPKEHDHEHGDNGTL